MPRYFFHRTDGGFSPDTEGTDLPVPRCRSAPTMSGTGGTSASR